MDKYVKPQVDIETNSNNFKRYGEYAIRMGIVKPENKEKGGNNHDV